MQWLRSLAAFAALAVALLLWAEDADARLEGGSSIGSSATGTLLTPPVVAPAFAVMAANDHVTAAQPPYPGGSLGGLFNRPGLLGGFAAGFLGSGVLGLLFGHGLVGELGSVASVLGLFFQLALIAAAVPADMDVVERPQRAGLCRPVAAATGRSLPALAPRISSRRRGAGRSGRCRRGRSPGRQQVIFGSAGGPIAAPASRDMRSARRRCCCAARSARRIWCRRQASGQSRGAAAAAAWLCRNGVGPAARPMT